MKITKNPIQITTTLRGQVTVTYRTEGSDVYARALEFDLVGVGKSRESALRELQEIFSDYAEEILKTKGKVQFFNPSSPEEWENEDKQFFHVVFVLKAAPAKASSMCSSIHDVRKMRGSIRGVQLQPSCCM
ncbi:MAG: hypothetical protein NTZ09_07950 [Candidatus Hydrogenedentes bacterium]|nr:hypothetical protein [Candidatus Hydrogenedentota bacterium]